MAIVGSVGYVDPTDLVAFPAGNTQMNIGITATADGYLKKIKIHRTTGGTLKVSSWKLLGFPALQYRRQGFVIVSVPAGSGVIEIDLPTDLWFETGWHIGYYSADVALKGGGGLLSKRATAVGDVIGLGTVNPPPDAQTLWGELDDTPTPPSTGGRYFFQGAPP